VILIINQNDFLADLQEYLNDQEAIQLDINESNEFLVNDKHQADYFIKLSKQCEEDINDVKKYVEEERERINRLLDNYLIEQVQAIENRKRFYDDALETYIHRELDNTNKRSIKLPHGTLALKKQQPHYTYTDEDILEWAKEARPELIKTTIPEPKVSIDKKLLKEQSVIMDGLLYIDGVEVPGVQVEMRDDAFSIK
jgi:hypothetical protein